jgi:hypothetical protein
MYKSILFEPKLIYKKKEMVGNEGFESPAEKQPIYLILISYLPLWPRPPHRHMLG